MFLYFQNNPQYILLNFLYEFSGRMSKNTNSNINLIYKKILIHVWSVWFQLSTWLVHSNYFSKLTLPLAYIHHSQIKISTQSIGENLFLWFVAIKLCFQRWHFWFKHQNSMFDFGFAMFITALNMFVIYFLFVWRLENIKKLIETCGGFSAKSEHICTSTHITVTLIDLQLHKIIIFFFLKKFVAWKGADSTHAYQKLIEKIELFHKYFFVAQCIMTAFLAFIPLPYTAIRYYIFDMNEKAFFLFLSSWYVLLFHWYCYVHKIHTLIS